MKKIKLILTTICCLVGLGSFCSSNFTSGTTVSVQINMGTQIQRTLGNGEKECGRSSQANVQYRTISGSSNGMTVMSSNKIYCSDSTYYLYNNGTSNAKFYVVSGEYFENEFESDCPTCPSCPSCPSQFTSLECQSEYSLIPVSSVDSTYCENNNLCSSSSVDCPSGDYSSIYINGVLHDPAPVIDIEISDEIDWDYAYSGSGSQFNLDIVGYNVDYEKMGEVLLVQNYKPSSEDFTKLISSLVPYMKILVFVLFAYIVIKRLKKPFSSKLK